MKKIDKELWLLVINFLLVIALNVVVWEKYKLRRQFNELLEQTRAVTIETNQWNHINNRLDDL